MSNYYYKFFNKRQIPGDDRRERGLRINYGLNISLKEIMEHIIIFVRKIILRKKQNVNIVDGFKSNNSDFVGNYTMFKSNGNELYYDFRISENLDLNRNKLEQI